ncbi:endonuclease Q family protein [Bacillus taeanensis]|uniref:TIGR00375 family protein n=1 Tax=Bacillus taeanensis TaxID=273032 RepID=A0A366XXT9_9BACI|nr:endonuclease Q family protein [Bacillus taeanensis]RBW70378.1 TIGR00375 family protein [Bacillus taeanensis]
MNTFFADLHIHIGRTRSGKPVKITGSKSLTLKNILQEASKVKGLHLIGIIDCHVPEVMDEIKDLIDQGLAYEHRNGGIRFQNLTLILGSEIEIYDENCKGPIHILIYLPTLKKMKQFSRWLSVRMKNISLSSQRIYEKGIVLQSVVKELGGLFIPAHVFTPFKSLYGRGVKQSLTEVFNPILIDAVELGLSSNTEMADQIAELHRYPYLSNSDAHSLAKIAREYQALYMEEPTFKELCFSLKGVKGRKVAENYGLNPYLGKYYRTTCANCLTTVDKEAVCPVCQSSKVTKGVFERLAELKANEDRKEKRPPYIHQVPLEFIPGLGPKTLDKLRDHLGTDMDILHHVPEDAIKKVVSKKVADLIIKARSGKLELHPGGGGKYGSVKTDT